MPVVDVPCAVAVNLACPELRVGIWNVEDLAVLMAMPETSVDKDGRPVFREKDVRRAGQAFVVHTVTEALAPEGVP